MASQIALENYLSLRNTEVYGLMWDSLKGGIEITRNWFKII
jgi:hypothetical protein